MKSGEQSAHRFVAGAELGTLEPWLEALRRRGCCGGCISEHRALRHSPSPRKQILGSVLLTTVMLVLWYLSIGGVARLWQAVLEFCRMAVGMGGYTTILAYELGPFRFEIPYLTFSSGSPDNLLWWIGMALAAVLVAVSFLTPRRYLPAAYFLRVVAFFQLTAQLFFALWLHHFPYGGAGYVHGMLIAGLMFVSLIPLVLGLTYYMFDFSLGRKVLLTLVMVGHLTIMIPFQYFMHAYVVHHLSLLFMPLMFFIFGLPANVMMFIAFFGWGFSWRNRWDTEGNGDRGRLVKTVAVAALLAVCLGAAPPAEGQTAQDLAQRLPEVIPDTTPPLVRTVTAGFGWGEYTGDTNPNNGQFVSVAFSRPGRHAYNIGVGRQERFTQKGYGIGAGYTHVIDPATSLSVGANTGTGDLTPKYRLGVSGSRSVKGNVVTLGLSHEQSKVDIKTNGVHVGVTRWLAHFIFSAGGSVYYGTPGKTTSPSFTLGATYYIWQRLYAGVGFSHGRVSYLVLGPEDILVNYDSTGYNVGVSYWIDGKSGLNVGFDYGDTDFFIVRGYNLSYFRQF